MTLDSNWMVVFGYSLKRFTKGLLGNMELVVFLYVSSVKVSVFPPCLFAEYLITRCKRSMLNFTLLLC